MKRFFLILALLVSVASAAGLDGRRVILVVSEHRTGDPKMKVLETELRRLRKELGFSKAQMPLVFMGFKDSDTERTYFDRLGFQAFDSPIICVAEWGNPARFGPKKVVDYAIARSATQQHVPFIVNEFLKAEGHKVDPTPIGTPTPMPPPPPSDSAPGKLELLNVRFEASGKPLYMTNVGVRIKNWDEQTVRGIKIRFYCKPPDQTEWVLMGTKTINKIPAGHFVSRDIVGDTRKFNLVDPEMNAVRCPYRIEVEQGGRVITEEGVFTPNESPVGVLTQP